MTGKIGWSTVCLALLLCLQQKDGGSIQEGGKMIGTFFGFTESVAPTDERVLRCTSCGRVLGDPSSGVKPKEPCPFCVQGRVTIDHDHSVAELFGATAPSVAA
ncbi:MAG: hypothetical protein V1778_05400 [bacterium]